MISSGVLRLRRRQQLKRVKIEMRLPVLNGERVFRYWGRLSALCCGAHGNRRRGLSEYPAKGILTRARLRYQAAEVLLRNWPAGVIPYLHPPWIRPSTVPIWHAGTRRRYRSRRGQQLIHCTSNAHKGLGWFRYRPWQGALRAERVSARLVVEG